MELYKKIGSDVVYVRVFITPKPSQMIKDTNGCYNYYLQKIKESEEYLNLLES
ncbi:MAG: hypothetical protein K6357_02595 [Elusimicrobiota bacterium]